MLASNPGEWRRALKALVEGLDPDVGLLIGREDPTGHHPLSFTLDGCRETLRLYDDQAVTLATDEAVRSALQQEIKDVLALLRLKVEIVRAVHRAHPAARLRILGPLACPDGEVVVEIRGGPGLSLTVARARTYFDALQLLHTRVVAESPPGRP